MSLYSYFHIFFIFIYIFHFIILFPLLFILIYNCNFFNFMVSKIIILIQINENIMI